jgi:hypothetical protein
MLAASISSKHFSNDGKLLPDYRAQQPRRQPSSCEPEISVSKGLPWKFEPTLLSCNFRMLWIPTALIFCFKIIILPESGYK